MAASYIYSHFYAILRLNHERALRSIPGFHTVTSVHQLFHLSETPIQRACNETPFGAKHLPYSMRIPRLGL